MRVLALVFLLAAVTIDDVHAQSRPAVDRRTVVVGTTSEPGSLNPLLARNPGAGPVLAMLFVVDVQRDAEWRPFAQGVETLPSLRDGTWRVAGERMMLVWTLRPRSWHDGRPVTCGDYVFAYKVLIDPQFPIPDDEYRRVAQRIESVTCPKGWQSREIVVTWKERFAYANLGVTPIAAVPRHILERHTRGGLARLREIPYGNEPKVIIGDGAYRLTEWRRGESLTVESIGAHPVLGTPKIRRIVWRFMPDPPALVAGLLSGSLDAISLVGLPIDQGLQLDRQSSAGVRVLFTPGLLFEHIDFNLGNPLLQDLRVRRAIAHGINRTQIVQQLFSGRQPVADSYLPPRHGGYTKDVARYPYDPSRARALLRDAEFTLGPDGIMRHPDGRRLSLELTTTAGVRVRERIQAIIQQQLQQVGIEIVIQNYPARILFDEISKRRRFTGLMMYSWVFFPTSDCDELYTIRDIPSQGNGWTGLNYPGYSNARMDQVCRQIPRELDEQRRVALLRESARIFARDLPALPLYFRVNASAVKVGLENFVPTIGPDMGLRPSFEGWNAHAWQWK